MKINIMNITSNIMNFQTHIQDVLF